MKEPRSITVDGNEAAASVAYRTNEVIAIYPITPASPMGELSDLWAAHGRQNLWGTVPTVTQLQSEAGAAGTMHGSLQAGALTTTFTASQGLLLMMPNMYKIAGELTACVVHVAARSIATHALSIFGDHSDVMACRQTGFAMLASGSVQEAHDFACISHAATLRSRIPFMHFFDGFRTSHEISKICELSDDDLRAMLDDDAMAAHRARGLTPDHPVIRGTAQNPDVFFQAREAANRFYERCPEIVKEEMARFAKLTGRSYDLFNYEGAPDADRVIVLMGSGAEAVHDTVDWMNQQGDKVGVLKVRLYRPFCPTTLIRALPPTVEKIAVLDRTKEPGAIGDPLYLDVLAAARETEDRGEAPWKKTPTFVGGRYGLSSKEFDPAMVKGIFDELAQDKPKNHFTVGIVDDVTHTSIKSPGSLDIESEDTIRAVFYGLGSDGTVGANKNSIKIIGGETDNYAQAYFVYDSKKAGAITISHLRFGPRPIRATHLIHSAGFVACHQFQFLEKLDVLEYARRGGTFLLNAPYPADEVWDQLPLEIQQTIIDRELKVFAIDAYQVAKDTEMGRRVNTIMQVCFFAISGVLERDTAIEKIKQAIQKTYANKGEAIVKRNMAAVDQALGNLHEVRVPKKATATKVRESFVAPGAPEFAQRVTATMLAGHGDSLPVSAFPVDGTWPSGTSKWEKRSIAYDIPTWDEELCIQCNKCAFVCPHAAIRAKVYEPEHLDGAPASFKAVDYKARDWKGFKYTIQVAPEDCTGCTLCFEVCPAKDKQNPSHRALEMKPLLPLREQERDAFAFFLDLPEADRTRVKLDLKSTQLFEPLFEFSGACAGCGETPYLKLLTQLFGDRLLVANATGCSSIFGGNLPTTPWSQNRDGRGPAWSNSLFEDNAEFGFGFRLAVDAQRAHAETLLRGMAGKVGDTLATALLEADQSNEAGIAAQRERVIALKTALRDTSGLEAALLTSLADYLVDKSVWLVGGDGWAYDIGYGGLDHVLSQPHNVNVLVLDTEVYSNTGGQASKATPLGAAAKFAMAGKGMAKKDLGLEAMSYGHVYVAQVAFGAKDTQTLKALLEAEAYPGPSLVIAYSTCIAHGYDLARGLDQMKLATESGAWPLYRFDPRSSAEGKPRLHLDSKSPTVPLADYMRGEARFRMAQRIDPKRFERLLGAAQAHADQRFKLYEQLGAITVPDVDDGVEINTKDGS